MNKKFIVALLVLTATALIFIAVSLVSKNTLNEILVEKGLQENTYSFKITPFLAVFSLVMSLFTFFFRIELSGSRIIQIFENRLFILIQNHENIRDRIEVNEVTGTEKGHNAITSILNQINIDCENLDKLYGENFNNLKEAYSVNYNSLDYFKNNSSYKEYFEKKGIKNNYKYILFTYFDSLFSIFHLIQNERRVAKSRKKRNFYANIVKNNLYIDELALLYYHCISGVDRDWYINNYIEEFRILSSLPKHYHLVQKVPPIDGLKIICQNIEEDHQVEEYFNPKRCW